MFSEVKQTSVNPCAWRAANGLLALQDKRLTTAGVVICHLGRSMLSITALLAQLAPAVGTKAIALAVMYVTCAATTPAAWLWPQWVWLQTSV